MKEHLRAVIWPREQQGEEGELISGKKVKIFRYAIVGVLITNTRLNLKDDNEIMIDGNVEIGEQLELAPQREPRHKTGDATDVLLSLDTL